MELIKSFDTRNNIPELGDEDDLDDDNFIPPVKTITLKQIYKSNFKKENFKKVLSKKKVK